MALTARAFHSLTSKFCSVTLKTTASTIHGSNATLFTDCTLGTPEIPKRPLTPFFAFAQDERSNILAGNSSMKITEVMKIASQRFKALSDGEKQVKLHTYIRRSVCSMLFLNLRKLPTKLTTDGIDNSTILSILIQKISSVLQRGLMYK